LLEQYAPPHACVHGCGARVLWAGETNVPSPNCLGAKHTLLRPRTGPSGSWSSRLPGADKTVLVAVRTLFANTGTPPAAGRPNRWQLPGSPPHAGSRALPGGRARVRLGSRPNPGRCSRLVVAVARALVRVAGHPGYAATTRALLPEP